LIIEHYERERAPIKPLDAIDATRYRTGAAGFWGNHSIREFRAIGVAA
jgi:hypothetical protein